MNQTKEAKKLEPSPEIQRVDVELLRPDPENVRRSYAEESMNELAESILEEGLIQNLEAGPDGVVHIGNRRLKAIREQVVPYLEQAIRTSEESLANLAKGSDQDTANQEALFLAKLKNRLADRSRPLVRVLSDEEVKSAKIRQLIENLQREDVSAFDEAQGYAKLLEQVTPDGHRVHSPESLAKRIGKGRTAEYVRARLKVLNAPKPLLAALEDGKVGVRQCQLVGRIPTKKLREEAAKRVLKPKHLDRPLSDTETAELIREDFMVPLRAAPFDPENASLVPDAGVCSACEFRSGNDPDLKDELQIRGRTSNRSGVSPDLCTNPACFRDKGAAAWELLKVHATKDGFQVAESEEGEGIFSGPGGTLPFNSKFVDLDERPDPRDVGHYDQKKTPKWRVLLKGSEIQVTKVRHPKSGRVHDLVNRTAAKTAVEMKAAEANQPSVFSSAKEREEQERKQKAAERKKARVERLVAIAVFDHLADAMTPEFQVPKDLAGADLKAPVEELLKRTHLDAEALFSLLEISLNASADSCAFFAEWLKLERPKPGASGRDYLPVIMAMVRSRDYCHRDLVALAALATVAPSVKYHGAKSTDLLQFCAVYQVDVPAISKKVRAGLAEKDARAKKPKPKPEPAPAKPASREAVQAANEDFEAKQASGEDVALADVEKAHGLKPDQLRNYRKNKNRAAKSTGKGEAK